MVASRWPYRLPLAASVRLSTSASVRYSRVRNSALGLRTGIATVRFSVTGATSFRCDLAMVSRAPAVSTVRIISILRTVASANFCALDAGCSPQHLKRYLAEFDFRYNERMALGVSDESRTTKSLRVIVGKRLTDRDS